MSSHLPITKSIKLADSCITGSHILLLASLVFDSAWHETAGMPTELIVRCSLDGNVVDDIHFVFDWSHLIPSTVDEFKQGLLDLENESLMTPRGRDAIL
jgi:hypothetical protein